MSTQRSSASIGRLVAGTALLAIVLGMAACGGDRAQAKPGDDAPAAIPVETEAVTRRSVAASYAGSASLEVPRGADVIAKTSGIALEVLVEEGDAVRAGQPLLRLDPDRPRLAVQQSRATMGKLENSYRRAQQLVGQQMISANDLDQIKFDLDNARAQYEMAQLELSYTTVTAPISGVISQRMIRTGNFVQINTPIFSIVDNSRIEATLNVPERELRVLKRGQPVRLQVDALPGETFDGVVERVSPVVDSGSGTFRVVCAFEGSDMLRAGMFGRIRIDYDQRAAALVIPRSALLEDDDTAAVYTVRDGKAVRVPVTLGYIDGNLIEVRDGLSEGEPVVTAGKVALREGSPVQVIGEAPEPAPDADAADASSDGAQ
ncbi:efflux RND transporter periplasmic adaptor subunit [Luteimonas sp. BDR2-5]|uniref:efflux RND transporter periplasmic adaptor subunit n=1 Tax=Proluteimonas luteida TaxID=2878685 RepID=UPI001E61F967|nr:efflux RND transporter periplasmic adaptor subunit [Luteimonas sp. BDR2-5]MCD9026955.1 efflux RND transporter periplasmic adaptor subunit [Luteimonas sp. BDR2-5]